MSIQPSSSSSSTLSVSPIQHPTSSVLTISNPIVRYIVQHTPFQNAELTELNLLSMQLKDKDIVELTTILRRYSNITSLNLERNGFGFAGVNALAKFLIGNTTLIQLDLSMNDIRDEGAEALATSLESNTTLICLHLSVCHIRDEGAGALATSLIGNTTLTQLNLTRNWISAKGAGALATSLESNTTLIKLDLAIDSDFIDDRDVILAMNRINKSLLRNQHGKTGLVTLCIERISTLALKQVQVLALAPSF